MKNLIYDKENISHFSGGYILVDNTALIESSREHNNPMLQFLDILSNLNCDLITTPSVNYLKELHISLSPIKIAYALMLSSPYNWNKY